MLIARARCLFLLLVAVAPLGGGCDETCTLQQTRCRGLCVDVRNDPFNCGICGGVCGSGRACAGGQCVAAPCDGGPMCGDAGCVNLASDSNNCGACGTVCATGATCVNGACSNSTCAAQGLGDCGGVCKNITSDPSNCGACDQACGVGVSCVAGRCVGCASGYALCPSGCSDLRNDPQNCGVCGSICASTFCDNGICL